MQTIIYWCLLYKENKSTEPFNLFNIKTGENYRVEILEPEVNVDKILEEVIGQKVKMKDVELELEEIQKQLKSFGV